MTVAAVDPWRFQAHPEVWALVIGLGGLWWYAMRRIGPAAVRGDERVLSRGQAGWFAAALLTLWFASDWPVHDLAEERLYAIHMFQHLLLSFIVPAMALLATPTWLARLVVGSGRGYQTLRWMTRLIPASIFFNAVVIFTHAPFAVEASVSNAAVHYGLHLLVFSSGLIMWMGVCGPLPELRFRMPVQMGHLFLQSIIPVVPAGWLTFADTVVYHAYDTPYRMWGLSAVEDQQLAAVVMKVAGSTFLWVVIVVLFARWVELSGGDERARGVQPDRRAPEADLLTWADVERELATAPPGPAEPRQPHP